MSDIPWKAAMDRLVSRQNIERYCRLANETTNAIERRQVMKLLAEEEAEFKLEFKVPASMVRRSPVSSQMSERRANRSGGGSAPQVRGGGGGGGHGGGGGGHGHGGHHSDIRLKEDVVLLARLDNGIELYRFRYKGSDHAAYVGVMAQEVQKIEPSAVWRGPARIPNRPIDVECEPSESLPCVLKLAITFAR